MGYSFDTSAMINPWKFMYPIRHFPSFWRTLDDVIRSGELLASEMVLEELKQKSDELLEYVNERRALFVPVDEPQMRIVTEIVNRFPKLADYDNTKEVADPYVVALAKQRELMVVTDEQRPPRGKVKIPEVCQYMKVKCIGILEFLDEIQLVL